jgi:hypothetical protein
MANSSGAYPGIVPRPWGVYRTGSDHLRDLDILIGDTTLLMSTVDAGATQKSRHDDARGLLLDDATQWRRKAAGKKGA